MGGEVRYRSNFEYDNGTIANIAMLSKTTPGYSGTNYNVATGPSGSNSGSITLTYSSSGSWSISMAHGDGSATGSPLSGTWTTTPSSTYEYSISSWTDGGTSGLITYSPSGTTGYSTISGSTQICQATLSATSSVASTGIITFGITVRVVGQTTPTLSSSINMIIGNSI